MTFAEPDPTDDLAALQRLPEALSPDDEPGDPAACATTGVARPPLDADGSGAGPALDSPGSQAEPEGVD